MKKKIIIGLLTSLILAIAHQVVYSQAKNNSPQYQTFEELCFNKDNLTPETRHTVEVLLEVARTKEYNTAQSVLEQNPELLLEDRQITDVSPLANFTNLIKLELNKNQITDVSPLANLIKLE